MVNWAASPGGLAGYRGSTENYQPDEYLFASPGSVDVNAVTRLQYQYSHLGIYNHVLATPIIEFTDADVTAHGATDYLTASMFVAPASSFADGVTPTPLQILTSGPSVYRAGLAIKLADLGGAGGRWAFTIYGPRADQLTPGTKYWVMVMPTLVTRSGNPPPSVANDRSFPTDINVIGRSLSLWSNRPPNAPVITSPASGVSVSSGAVITLSYTQSDPDAVVGDTTFTYRDDAGVQVQYAPKATAGNPSPTWQDLPIANPVADVQAGWFIKGSTAFETSPRTNLVPNPSFETNLTGWSPNTVSAVLTQVADPFSGADGMSIAFGSTTLTDAGARTSEGVAGMPVTGGLDYNFSSYFKGSALATRTVGISVSWWNSAGSPVGTSPSTSTAITGAWQRVNLTATAPSTAAYARISLNLFRSTLAPDYGSWSGSEAVVVDAVLVEQTNVVGDYFDTEGVDLITYGARTLWENGTIDIKCSDDLIADHGMLPAGEWQIRVRTFDFGEPYPVYAPVLPGGQSTPNYTPTTYPAANASPWSTPVLVTVTSQIPPPIPLSPINSLAVPEGDPVVLTWRYRNTFLPPYPQAERLVQIRESGETDWITLVDEVSASDSFDTTGSITLEATTQYEWRVQVTDADAMTSDFSEIARFWVVPSPGSGEVAPLPSETIGDATLGCGTHRVYVYRRGGTRRVGEIRNHTYVDWNRVRDDISTAKITVSDWDIDCGNLLSLLQCWAYEIVVYRDNGFSVDRVWEGPITLLTYEQGSVTIMAKDVMGYAYRRIIKQAMNDMADGDTVTSRAARALQNAFAPDDPNVLAYLQVLASEGDAMEYRSIPAYSRTAFEEVDDMAANSGLDYTAVGRAILLWGTKHRIGTLPEFRDEDLGSPPIVSEYGMSFANRYVVSDGNGVWGEATRLDVSGNDENYGLVEMLSSSWASDSTDEEGTYTAAGLATIIESFEGYAERSISDRYPPPVVVRVPDNTTLNPGAVISIQHLVPGVVIPLRSVGTLRKVVANQKLDQVKVVEQGGKETISITLSPFSRDDASSEGVEAE